ncbi:UDP-glucose 4-epimerase GalE [Caldimonas thermodepolymerans]|jgi:UDP-glucose 4-epimerase|uniref:UDP-glucose 4-epimerase n=1 Tax=Caldimonas thermodepolymerans TaxID=215580 RepID=A0A2S5T8W9_9BURK|nr:UDP-glucose 4-epimerase GalE [Caldimonas thermodepolymerans]PPE71372.1 UDP-glucose 4-epimerase GalE [Caldimonas thermodepolymerans]QPC32548.1 UDP-glucose 4-epimerase GalE [Caldimonas thermodepolymerans]RDH98945.1 UDP-galactose 4-epimerase [Caldimonas thermodepolymerans]TCP06344.1 UDP-galactose 4-epimerase [Caldimonas thermodepolymerans]UZG45348.1 UDP-glucose 4-epimerase GalE [Caldimonas thermodepolymerans]
MPTILLTGATGYIASHTWLSLQEAGYDVVGADNFANSSPEVLNRLARLSGRAPVFHRLDVGDPAALRAVFEQHRIDAVVHFAAYKAVGESTAQPLMYYRNNLGSLLTVCETMAAFGVHRLVFSSSATVYGKPRSLPIREDAPLSATNPYGATKLMSERILHDLQQSDPRWQVACLRYFNPVGAHESGLIGEDPRGVPNNLMPYVAQVAVGQRPKVQVFGSDYDTPDGTGVRDYIHVVDLAEGHVAALRHLFERQQSLTVNLGTGRGYSVLEVIRAYERASGRPVPYEIVARRPGDVDACYADPGLARTLLGWQATRDLDAMCADSWRWQRMNPQGFGGSAPG